MFESLSLFKGFPRQLRNRFESILVLKWVPKPIQNWVERDNKWVRHASLVVIWFLVVWRWLFFQPSKYANLQNPLNKYGFFKRFVHLRGFPSYLNVLFDSILVSKLFKFGWQIKQNVTANSEFVLVSIFVWCFIDFWWIVEEFWIWNERSFRLVECQGWIWSKFWIGKINQI